MATLTARCALEMDCPKEVVVWNYYDHEHVVGTHYKYYSEPRVVTRWFHATWEEDAPMRIRRWKVWKLGFRDFRGIDFINKKTAKPADLDPNRPYPLRLPVPKTRESPPGSGYRRPFDESVEVG